MAVDKNSIFSPLTIVTGKILGGKNMTININDYIVMFCAILVISLLFCSNNENYQDTVKNIEEAILSALKKMTSAITCYFDKRSNPPKQSKSDKDDDDIIDSSA